LSQYGGKYKKPQVVRRTDVSPNVCLSGLGLGNYVKIRA
jgi:hypothetical protein